MNLHFNNLLKNYAGGQAFSAREAREKLNLSRRTIQRLMTWVIEAKKIESFGQTRSDTQYRVTLPKTRAA